MGARILIIAMLCLAASAHAQQYPFSRYGKGEGLPQNHVTDVVSDHRGFLWVATAERGIARFDGKEFLHFGGHAGFIHGGVFALATDGDRWLFAGGNEGVRVLLLDEHAADRPDTAMNQILHAVRGPVRFLETRRDRKLYIETFDQAWLLSLRDSSLQRCSTSDREYAFLQSRLPGMQVNGMARDCSGRFWVATDSGLVALTDASRHVFVPDGGASTHNITSVCVDRETNVWCGSSDGLYLLVPQRFVNLTPGDSSAITCMIETRDRGMYFGTRRKGVFRIFDGPRRQISTRDGLPSDDILSMHELATGEILIATSNGLVVWGEAGVLPMPATLILPDQRVNQIHRAKDGSYWFATMNGLVNWDGERSMVFTMRDGLPSNRIACLAEDAYGQMIVGTHDGLARARSTGAGDVQSIHELGGIHVSALFFDSKERLWIGTVGSGVIVRNDGKLVRLGEAQGLASGNIAFIGQDNYGALYFGSNRGVTVLPQENLQYLLPVDSAQTVWTGIPPAQLPFLRALSMFSLTGMMGLSGEEMEDGAVLRDRAGRMWFGSSRGATSYNPSKPSGVGQWVPPICRPINNSKDAAIPLRVILSELWINDTSTAIRDLIEMDENDHVLRARVLLPSFRNPGQVHFLYQLQGMEYTWHRSDDGRILYTGLEPGSYTLAVQATIGEGIWTHRQQLLRIEVLPPLHRTYWFWIIVILCAVGAGMLLQRTITRRRNNLH
ncbi:MAG: two-component regulator propeller domain-containing protein [Bacteroidota bacterium]